MANPNPKPLGDKRGRRPKGAKTKVTRQALDAMSKRYVAQKGRSVAKVRELPYATPLEYMIHVLLDPQSSKAMRMWAAEKAAPYVHRKMPLAIEGGSPTKPIVLATMQQLANLNDDQLRTLQSLSEHIEQNTGEDVMKMITHKVLEANAAEDLDDERDEDDDA